MLSKLSVKKPYTVIVGIILVLVLGYISFTRMTTDLMPSMTLPYVVVYTPWVGATPERVEEEIVRPMEAAFATLTDIKKVTARASDNVGVVIMTFNDGANMDTALIEISAKVDQLKGSWDDEVGAPVTMRLNPDMLPVAILSVTRDDMDILALSDYVTKDLVPAFESLGGVASVTASGVIEQEIDVTIEQRRIDVLNSAVLREIDAELADVEQQLNDAQAQISDGRQQLARMRSAAYAQINSALSAIRDGESQIQPAIEQMTAQRDELIAQRAALVENIEKLEQLLNMSDDEKERIRLAGEMLAALKKQRAELEAQLGEGGDGTLCDAAALAAELAEAKLQRESLNAERLVLQQMISDLQLLDSDGLTTRLAEQQKALAECEQALSTAVADREPLANERDQLLRELASLEAQILGLGGPSPAPSDAPTADSTEAPTEAPTEGPTEAPTETPTEGPTEAPTEGPTEAPTENPTEAPTEAPTESPTETPVQEPTEAPVLEATEAPVQEPTEAPAQAHDETPEQVSEELPAQEPAESHAEEAADMIEAEPIEPTAAEPVTIEKGESAQAPAAEEASASEETPSAEAAQTALLWPFVALAEEGEGDLSALIARRDAVLARINELNQTLLDMDAEIARLGLRVGELQTEIAALQASLPLIEGGQENIAGRVAEAEAQIAALEPRIAALDAEIAELEKKLSETSIGAELIRQQIALLDQQISALEATGAGQAAELLADEAKLRAQLEQARAGLTQMDDGIQQLNAMIDKLNQGVIPGGFIEGIDEDMTLAEAKDKLDSARAQAASGFAQAEAMLNDAAAELAKARKEFMEKRDEAYENAGLDGVITMEMIAGILGAQNMSMPAGYVKNADGDNVLVRVGDKFKGLDELRLMKLFSLGLDSIDDVRLLDVASVEVTDDREDVFTKLNGNDGILLTMEKQSTFSTADVAKTVLARAAELQAAEPNLHIVDLMNQGEYIDIVVDSVLDNLIIGGALAILVLLLFLMDWRPTLIVAFSIPISVVVAFVCMYFTDITLNVLSLSGLALGIGMLVDNSIVSIENIYRLHDEEGVPLLRACVEGVQSVFGALFASTLTTICVFLPIVFVQGMARDLFQDMGLTIAYSLLASLFVAMTVVPMMTSFLMRASKPRKHRVFSKFQAAYTALLKGALRAKPLVLLAAIGLLAFSGYEITRMGISFMPEVNSRQMSAALTPDQNLSLKDQRAQAMSIMEDIMEIEGVESIGLMSGSGSILTMATGGDFSYYIIVDENAGRDNADIAADIDALAQKYDAKLTAQASTMDISMLIGSGISADIMGDDMDTLQKIALDVAEIARNTEGTADVSDGLEESVPEMRITVDKEKAIDEGLTVGQVLQFVAQKLVGKVKVSSVTLNGRALDIMVIEGRNSGLTPQDVENLEIEVEKESEDTLVRIGDIAEVSDARSLSTINREDQRREITVSFAIADGYAANKVSAAFEKNLEGYAVPDGYTIKLSGENEATMEILNKLVWMILVAVLFIFLIMVAQFQSFKSPIIVMFTIPLAFTGGLLGLLLTGMDLSIVSIVGFLVLSGVVVNNGIVFIDCVNQLRIGGMEKRDALIEAGRQRLRPILMTAMTTILGMSTMALGQGMGAEMMQPMAVVSVGGLTYATLMTLFVVPVLYDLFNGKTMKAREIQMIREAAGLNGDEVLDGAAPTPIGVISASPAPAPTPAGTISASPAPAAPVVLTPAGAISGSPAPAPTVPVVPTPAPPKPLRVKLGKKKV